MLAPPPAGPRWNVFRAAASLSELAYLERASAHVLAGWIPKVPEMAVKVDLGRRLFRTMDRATRLRARLAGLTRAVGAEPGVPEGCRLVMRRVDAAPGAGSLLASLSGVVWPRLTELYQRHASAADPLGDAASVELIGSFLSDLDRAPAMLAATAEPGFVAETERLWERRAEGPDLPFDEALWAPLDRVPSAVRPAGLARCERGSLGVLTVDSVREPEDVARFLHSDLDEEYTTLELMARNSYEHPDMPWAFHVDMCRQASDEARHAQMMLELLEARGYRYGAFPIATGSYDGLYRFGRCEPGSRKELLWRMLIRQTFMEGLALDSLAHDVKRRANTGQDDIIRALEYILRDEVFHVNAGMRWSAHLIGGDRRAILQERYEALTGYAAAAEAERAGFVERNLEKAMAELAILEEGKRRRGGKPPDRPLNRTGRLEAGLDEGDILQILSWGYATDVNPP